MAEDFTDKYGQRMLLALRRIIRAVDSYSRKLYSEHDITGPQLICLLAIVNDGPITLSSLGKLYHLSPSTVNGIIDRLEVKGLVVRTRDITDRRKWYISPTKAGIKLIKTAPSPMQDKFTEAVSRLPELEQAAIALSLERIVELMEVGRIDAAPILATETTLPFEEKR